MASRQAKEDFVAHLNGSDIYQIYFIILTAILQILIWKLTFIKTYYALEYCVLVIPMILSVTLLCNYLPYVILLQLAVILFMIPLTSSSKRSSMFNFAFYC